MPIQPAHDAPADNTGDPSIITYNADRTATVLLSIPIPANGEDVDRLTLRRPTAGDLEATDGLGDVAKANKLIERLAGIPRSSVLKIDAGDYSAIGEVISHFLERSRRTGANI